MVPSILGFVCKPDMPPHINILFRARPSLEWVPLPKKPAIKNYSGIFDDEKKNLVDLFEKNKPQNPQIELSKYNTKLKNIIEKNEKNRNINRRKLKECKYFFIFLVSILIFFFLVSFFLTSSKNKFPNT
jgi:hypothetical protein